MIVSFSRSLPAGSRKGQVTDTVISADHLVIVADPYTASLAATSRSCLVSS